MPGFNRYDLGGCNCPGCSVAFLVRGCGGLAYAGVTVSVYTADGGTLLDSGPTDATGHVTLSWSGGSGSYHVTVTGQNSRFAAYGQTLTLTCGSPRTIGLLPAPGYACFGAACLVPVPTTLTATVTGPFGTQTGPAVYDGTSTNWTWSYTDESGNVYTVEFAGGGATVTIFFATSGSGGCTWAGSATTCPPSFSYSSSAAADDFCGPPDGWAGSVTATE